MALKYKIDILSALKAKGFTSYRLRNEKIIGESQIQQIRTGRVGSPELINRICFLLDCQPGDVLEYVKESSEREE